MSTARFNNIHLGLTQADAIGILNTPIDQLESSSDYYMAAAHLINFPGDQTEFELLKFLASDLQDQSILLAKRKVIEVLARLGSKTSIPSIGLFLDSADKYIVENAVWALQELKCDELHLHKKIVELLEANSQNQRVLIQCLAELNIIESLPLIEILQDSENHGIRGAAISGYAKLSGERMRVNELVDHFTLANQMDRQFGLQDAINCDAIELIPEILTAPVSPAFRMRALKSIWPSGIIDINGLNLFESLNKIIIDHPDGLQLVHRYESEHTEGFLIQELFSTDFSRCYLALQTISKRSPEKIWPLLEERWHADAFNDYGAHYFFMHLFGHIKNWPKYALPAIKDILIEAINNNRPQFLKSIPAAIYSLGCLDPDASKGKLPGWLVCEESPFWQSRYAALIILEKLYSKIDSHKLKLAELAANDPEPYVRMRSSYLLESKHE